MDKKEIEERISRLKKSEESNNNILLFFKEIIKNIDSGDIERQKGCYFIAEFIGHPAVESDPKLEDITLIAGRLEIASNTEAAVKNPQEEYSLLKALINKY